MSRVVRIGSGTAASTDPAPAAGKPGFGLPDRGDWPELTPELGRAVAFCTGPDGVRYLPRPGDPVVSQARTLMRSTKGLLDPPPLARIEEWMDRVQVAVANPPADDDARMRVAAIMALSGDLPAACWTVETWRSFLRRGPEAKFWPGASEVDAFLRPIGDELRARAEALHRIAAVGRALPAPVDPTPEDLERAAWQAKTDAEKGAVIDAIRARHGMGPSRHGRQETPVFQKNDVIRELEGKQSPRPSRYPTPEKLVEMRDGLRSRSGLPPLAATRPPGASDG